MATSGDADSRSEATALAQTGASQDFTVRACADDTGGELDRRVSGLTEVLSKRQKLLYVDMGAKPAEDSSLLSAASLTVGVEISMMGFA